MAVRFNGDYAHAYILAIRAQSTGDTDALNKQFDHIFRREKDINTLIDFCDILRDLGFELNFNAHSCLFHISCVPTAALASPKASPREDTGNAAREKALNDAPGSAVKVAKLE
jgi:hypothetical protein